MATITVDQPSVIKKQITQTSNISPNDIRKIKEVRHGFEDLEPIFLRNNPVNQGMAISAIIHGWAGDVHIGISNDDDQILFDYIEHEDLPIPITSGNRVQMRTVNLTNIQAKYIVVEFDGTADDDDSYFCLFSGD